MALARQLVDTKAPYSGQPAEEKVRRMDEHPSKQQAFAQVATVVARNAALSRDARATYAVLRSYAWKGETTCWPSMDALKTDLAACEKSVHRWLHELVKHGLIRIERRGLQQTNLYHLLPVAGVPSPDRTQESTHSWPDQTQESDQEQTSESSQGNGRTGMSGLDRTLESTPIKEDEETIDKETTTANAVVRRGDAPAPPAHRERSAELCRTLSVELTETNLRAMDAVVGRWGERCESACTMSLEEKALDARAWLDTPAAKKKRRHPSVQYFRGWVERDVKRADADAQAAPQTPSQNGHHATAGPPGGSDPPAGSNPFLESMRRRQVARDATVVAKLIALGEKQNAERGRGAQADGGTLEGVTGRGGAPERPSV